MAICASLTKEKFYDRTKLNLQSNGEVRMTWIFLGVFGISLLALLLWMFRERDKKYERDEMKPDQWWVG